MSDQLIVLDGSTFFVSDLRGDAAGTGPVGFFHRDMRHLSVWRLLIEEEPIRVLSSRTVDYYSARIFGTLASVRPGDNSVVSIRRDRIVSDGIHEDLSIENHSDSERRVRVELEYGSDFADLFEVKYLLDKRGRSWTEIEGPEVTLWYERDGYRRGTKLVFDAIEELDASSARFELVLAPRQRWDLCIDVHCLVDGELHRPRAGHGGFGTLEPQMPLNLQQWMADAPDLISSHDPLRHTYEQSLLDLASLRFRPLDDLRWSLPAAGLPWFMALFGRDSLITAYQALPFQPHLAQTTLEALAELQATHDDAFRDAEPGKILHELRCGELTAIGERPHSPYYGSHDATALFLILLDEYERWTGDHALLRTLESSARAALAWIESSGDPDGDGYLEYQTRSSQGLANHSWKDSWNSMLFADGHIAESPIATCEIQGYAYDARMRTARLARVVWDDKLLAERLERDAAELKRRFNRDFWSERRGHFVLALDAAKRQVDSMTSNVGHLLWSGIVDDERAEATIARLAGHDMCSGWGIRTMAEGDSGYNPIEYHNGTVWPHDTSIVAEGLRRYGARPAATQLAFNLIEAADAFGHQLPEVFAGFPRQETTIPVEFPTSCKPQAWAAGAVLLAVRTLLGLDPDGPELTTEPYLPDEIASLGLRRVPFRNARVDLPEPGR